VVIACIFAFGTFRLVEQHQYAAKRKADEAGAEQRIAADQIAKSCVGSTGRDYQICIDQAHAAEYETERGYDDLQAQQDSANAAFWAWIVSGLQAVLGVIGIFFVARTLDINAEAVNAAREAMLADHRPWLMLTNPRVWFVDVDGGRVVGVEVDAKNIGRSPALSVELHCEISRPELYLENNAAVAAFVAEQKRPKTWVWGNRVIFPDQCGHIDWAGNDEGGSDGARAPRVILCATYKGSSSEDIFHTAYAVRVPGDSPVLIPGSDSIV
jgi:hypothetical protein